MDDLISRKAVLDKFNRYSDMWNALIDEKTSKEFWLFCRVADALDTIPSVPAVPLNKLCGLLAEMYHCPASGRPASNHACHPGCPDEAFEKLCGTDYEKHTDEERWHAFLTKWMEEQDAAD